MIGIISSDNLILKYNTELCNDFSNLIYRTIGMIKKYGLENEKLHIDNEKIDKELLNEVLRKYIKICRIF